MSARREEGILNRSQGVAVVGGPQEMFGTGKGLCFWLPMQCFFLTHDTITKTRFRLVDGTQKYVGAPFHLA